MKQNTPTNDSFPLGQQGVCPVCGCQDLRQEKSYLSDGQGYVVTPWTCPVCLTSGEDFSNYFFAYQDNVSKGEIKWKK